VPDCSSLYAVTRSAAVASIVAVHSIRSDTMRRFADPVISIVRSSGRTRTRSHVLAAMNVAMTTAIATAIAPIGRRSC
jgi:hypothetical protein